jgi:hypothetical protein
MIDRERLARAIQYEIFDPRTDEPVSDETAKRMAECVADAYEHDEPADLRRVLAARS